MIYLKNIKSVLFLFLLITLSITTLINPFSTTKRYKQLLNISPKKSTISSPTIIKTAKIEKETAQLNTTSNDVKKDIYSWLGTFSEVISLIEKKAFRKVDFSTIFQEALKSAIPNVDAHSAFFSQTSYKAAMESTTGEFSGIGIIVISKTPEDDSLVIIDVIQKGPADKAGLKSGDKIIEVNGEKLRGLSTDEVINKLKGKVKTKVNIKILRQKKPLEFNITRTIIKDQSSFCYHLKDPNIYYLSLKIFSEPAAKQVAKLLKKGNKGKIKGLIIDLRRNPGGILDSAVEMASLFLPKNSLVVTTKNQSRNVISSYKTKRTPVLQSNCPIFILIDNFTASASEILAGCLQHYSSQNNKLMVFLIGTSTFGKGSVQEVIPISNGCALKLTTMLYYLPNKQSIQAVGIKPDFLIKPKITPDDELKLITELYGKESSLKNYITTEEVKGEEIKKESEKKVTQQKKDDDKEKSWEEKRQEALKQDVQIQAAVNLINLLNLAKKFSAKLVDTRKKTLQFLTQNYSTDGSLKFEKIK